MKELSKKHPGFYRYTSKEKFDFIIDSTAQTITDSLTELGYYRKLKPLFAQIGCLHTGVSLSQAYQRYLDSSPTLLPLEIFIDSNKNVFISKSYDSTQNISIGSELLSINGTPTPIILNQLLPNIASDGYNETEKILLLNHRFAFWYQAMIDLPDAFTIELQTEGGSKTYTLKGVSKDVFPTLKSLENNYTKPLEFEVNEGIGVLKVHSFAKTAIKAKDQNFKKFIKAVFQQLKKEHIEHLVLDLRYNSGGTDGNAVFLAKHFFNQPFRYWDKIEVTEAIAKEIKGLNRLFYKRPRQKGDSYHWQKSWLTSEFDYYEVQKPAKNAFTGKTYLLTNGLCMSSCADFVAVLSHNQKAKIIGQETGGGFQGNTSGMMPHATIHTGLRITIPLQKYTNAVDPGKNFGRGTLPDYEIVPTFEAWVNKKDLEMEAVMKLIKH